MGSCQRPSGGPENCSQEASATADDRSLTFIEAQQRGDADVPAVPLADEPPAAVAHEVPRVAGPARAGRRRCTPRRWLSPAQKKVLLAWVRTHKEHCYPTPDEKVGLSQATGLGLQQVTHWFVNFRKRSPDFKAAWDRN